MALTFLPGIALSIIARKVSPWRWMYFLFLWPSTILHEFCHYLGFLLGGKPVSFNVLPKKQADGSYLLGSVQFEGLNWFNSFFIGLAPLLILVGLYYLAPQPGAPIKVFLIYWVEVGIFFAGALPSAQDLKIALIRGWPVFLAAIALGYQWLKVNPL